MQYVEVCKTFKLLVIKITNCYSFTTFVTDSFAS